MSSFFSVVLLLASAGAYAGGSALPCSHPGADGLTEHPACLERRGRLLFVKKKILRRLSFADGLASVWNQDFGWMYLDKKGKVIITGVSVMDNGPDDFHDGLVRIERQGKCGFADREGRTAIPPAYDGCLDFDNAAARVCLKCRSECADKGCEHHSFKGGDWLCINTSGDRVACAP